jgi:excisionase family DNA binding protein
MSRQVRTWEQTVDEATGMPRWDVLINGKQVPGGFVLGRPDGTFEAHYPHVKTFSRPTLQQAKERLEWAPPVSEGVSHIARETRAQEHDEDTEKFITREETASALGVSIWRVNAMVADGKLSARRTEGGGFEITKSSVEALLGQR